MGLLLGRHGGRLGLADEQEVGAVDDLPFHDLPLLDVQGSGQGNRDVHVGSSDRAGLTADSPASDGLDADGIVAHVYVLMTS